MNALTQSWLIHDRINRSVAEAVPAEAWVGVVPKAKSVSGQFAHIHNVRLMWLKSMDPALVEPLQKLEQNASPTEVCLALKASALAVASVIDAAVASGGRVKGFKPTVEAFVLYLVSHEAHHRAMAELALRQLGTPISDKASYGQWEWGTRLAELEAEG